MKKERLDNKPGIQYLIIDASFFSFIILQQTIFTNFVSLGKVMLRTENKLLLLYISQIMNLIYVDVVVLSVVW